MYCKCANAMQPVRCCRKFAAEVFIVSPRQPAFIRLAIGVANHALATSQTLHNVAIRVTRAHPQAPTWQIASDFCRRQIVL